MNDRTFLDTNILLYAEDARVPAKQERAREVIAAMITSAIQLHRLHSISFWDALIVRAAADAGCTKLLSEDLQHQRAFDALVIENPFVS